MINKIILCFVFGAYSLHVKAQRPAIDSSYAYNEVKVSNKVLPKASELILLDSITLQYELTNFGPLIEYAKRSADSSIAAVWDSDFVLVDNRLAMEYEQLVSKFDSVVFPFVYNHFMQYRFASNKKRMRRKYELHLSLVYYFHNRSISVTIKEAYTKPFYSKIIFLR